MRKILMLVSAFALLSVLLCGCIGNTCEYCGESTMVQNLVGDEADGIRLCNDCVQKMTMSKISFDFTCDDCHEEKLGKKNQVTVDGEEKIVCNTCYGYLPG